MEEEIINMSKCPRCGRDLDEDEEICTSCGLELSGGNARKIIRLNDYDSLIFRINFYSDLNDEPHKVLNAKPIYVKTKIKKGWVKCDLSRYRLVINEDFYVSIEGIKAWGNDEKLNEPTSHLILSGKFNENSNPLLVFYDIKF